MIQYQSLGTFISEYAKEFATSAILKYFTGKFMFFQTIGFKAPRLILRFLNIIGVPLGSVIIFIIGPIVRLLGIDSSVYWRNLLASPFGIHLEQIPSNCFVFGKYYNKAPAATATVPPPQPQTA